LWNKSFTNSERGHDDASLVGSEHEDGGNMEMEEAEGGDDALWVGQL
jgi:hypothetical protein